MIIEVEMIKTYRCVGDFETIEEAQEFFREENKELKVSCTRILETEEELDNMVENAMSYKEWLLSVGDNKDYFKKKIKAMANNYNDGLSCEDCPFRNHCKQEHGCPYWRIVKAWLIRYSAL